MPATAQKSPSVMKRDQLRMILFNMKKKEEYFEKEKTILELKANNLQEELFKKMRIISKLEIEISKLSFSLHRPKPKLVIMNVSNQNIQPETNQPSKNQHLRKDAILEQCCQHSGRRRTDSGHALPPTTCCSHRCWSALKT